jgi:hypothetical protein
MKAKTENTENLNTEIKDTESTAASSGGGTVKFDPNDPFNPEALRVTQDFATLAGVKKLITHIPVRKPSKTEWFRTHPDPAYRLQTNVLEIRGEHGSEIFLVPPYMAQDLVGEITPVIINTAITRQNVLFVWPIRLPDPDRPLAWHTTALEAAKRAQSKWMRMYANMSMGAYELMEATADLSEPNWPDLQFKEILAIAFGGRMIDGPDHPAVKLLQGRA